MSHHNHAEAFARSVQQVPEVMTYGGAATAIFSGLTLHEIGVIVGIVVAILGLILQIWVAVRKDKRDRDTNDQMRALVRFISDQIGSDK